MTKVLYPGSFDPITLGHMNIIEQAAYLYDKVIIAIMQNPMKRTHFFTMEERYEMISELYKHANNIDVVLGSGAAVDVALLHECKALIRGLRSENDLAEEMILNSANLRICDKKIRTALFLADEPYQFTSSTIVKQVLFLNKDVSHYLDPYINEKVLIKKKEFDKNA